MYMYIYIHVITYNLLIYINTYLYIYNVYIYNVYTVNMYISIVIYIFSILSFISGLGSPCEGPMKAVSSGNGIHLLEGNLSQPKKLAGPTRRE